MQPTIFSVILLALVGGVMLTADKLTWAWRLFAFCLIFGATSAAALTALGGASLLLPQCGLGVLAVAAIGLGFRTQRDISVILAVHVAAIALVAYMFLVTIFAPRVFAGAIDLVAMRPDVIGNRAVASPLSFRSSNITHSVYLFGSFLTAGLVSFVFYRRLPESEFRRGILVAAGLFIFFGLVDTLGAFAGQTRLLDFLRNANYAMVDQAIDGIKRISGNLAEPSAFAAMGVPLAVFGCEDWLRSRRASSGWIGLGVWTCILLSTSTTGIISVLVYLACLVPRMLVANNSFRRNLVLVFICFGIALLGAGFALISPKSFLAVSDFVDGLLLGKLGSESAVERGEWVMQGWDAFKTSYGLGVGVGSFRSSSFPTAVLGSVGVIGSLLMAIYFLQVGRAAVGKARSSLQRSAAWAALFAIVPALFSGVTPDPGITFGAFAGFALCPLLSRARVATGGLRDAPDSRRPDTRRPDTRRPAVRQRVI